MVTLTKSNVFDKVVTLILCRGFERKMYGEIFETESEKSEHLAVVYAFCGGAVSVYYKAVRSLLIKFD